MVAATAKRRELAWRASHLDQQTVLAPPAGIGSRHHALVLVVNILTAHLVPMIHRVDTASLRDNVLMEHLLDPRLRIA